MDFSHCTIGKLIYDMYQFLIIYGELHDDEKMLGFFVTERVTRGARSVRKCAASEPKTKTAAELRVHLHR